MVPHECGSAGAAERDARQAQRCSKTRAGMGARELERCGTTKGVESTRSTVENYASQGATLAISLQELAHSAPRPTSNCDAERPQQGKHGRRRYSEKWLVGISAAGILVSGLVFVIVLFPLIYSSSIFNSHSNYHGGKFDEQTPNKVNSGVSRMVSKANLILKGDSYNNLNHHNSGEPWVVTPAFHDYYSYMVNVTQEAMNTSVDPCHDFYQYACGSWGIHHPPPKGVSSWSNLEKMTLEIWGKMEEQIQRLVNDPLPSQNNSAKLNHSRSKPPRHNTLSCIQALVVDYYASCQNETHLSLAGVDPLRDMLSQMDQEYLKVSQKLQPLHAFQKILEYVHHDLTLMPFFSWKVEVDNVIPNAMAIELNVPNIDFLQQGTDFESNEKLIIAYKQHVTALLKIAGTFNINNLDKEVDTILEILKIYIPLRGSPLINRTSIENLSKLAPFLNWQEFFNKGFNKVGIFITKNEHLLSQVQNYLASISKQILLEISTNGIERLYIYLRWQVVQHYSQFLHQPARNTILPLLSETMGINATAIQHFRYRPCIKELEERLPLALSHLLLENIKEDLPHRTTIISSIQAVEEMANNIKMEYINFIDSFTWLKPQVKHVLLEKLNHVDIKVGYPPILDNHSELQEHFKNLKISKTAFFSNQITLLKFNQNNHMKLLRQPGEYSEWEILPPMSVISYYVYRRNALLVPLGGFIHPLYSPYLPASLTYATMGAFISHELGHSVDLVGRTRDRYGRANAILWDEATVKAFAEKVQCRINQYSQAYYPIKNLLTVAEVMADDGSISTTFLAAYRQLQQTRFPSQITNLMSKLNLSSEQFFFLFYAQLLCSASIPGSSIQGVEHYPPHNIRVTATLANTPHFQAAFGCHKGTRMNPEAENCQIW